MSRDKKRWKKDDEVFVPTSDKWKVAMEEYKAAFQAHMIEGGMFWSRHNVYLLVNGAVLTGFSLLLTQTKPQVSFIPAYDTLLFLLTLLGFVVSAVWFLVSATASAYLRHWIGHATKIEERKLKDLTLYKGMLSVGKWPWEKFSVKDLSLAVPFSFAFAWGILSFSTSRSQALFFVSYGIIFLMFSFLYIVQQERRKRSNIPD